LGGGWAGGEEGEGRGTGAADTGTGEGRERVATTDAMRTGGDKEQDIGQTTVQWPSGERRSGKKWQEAESNRGAYPTNPNCDATE